MACAGDTANLRPSAQEPFESFWRQRAADLRLISRQTDRNQRWYRRMQTLAGPNIARVLELGCGTAIDAYRLAEALPRAGVVGIDNSPAGLALARSLRPHFGRPIDFVQGSIADIPFADETFDLVFSSGVLEHFRDAMPAMRESRRVTRRGGLVVVHVPQRYNLYALYSNVRQKMGKWPFGWERHYSAGQLRELGRRAGLEPIAVAGTDFFSLEVLRYLNSERLRLSPDGRVTPPRAYRLIAGAIRGADALAHALIPAAVLARLTMNVIGFFRRNG
jgi:ubiquinone/menaquinone biosynthesis C-methylase UbiE